MYCQKCRTPIKLDPSLEDLNPAAFDLLVGSAVRSQQNSIPPSKSNYPQERKDLYDRVSTQGAVPLHKRTIPPPVNDDKNRDQHIAGNGIQGLPPDMSFIEITQSQIVPPEKPVPDKADRKKTGRQFDKDINGEKDRDIPLSTALEKNEKLFAILSSHSDIDHPICAECTSLLLASFNARLASATKERDAYAAFLKNLQQSAATANSTEDETKAEKELIDLVKKDQEAFEELKQLETEKAALEAELADLEEESRQLELEEEAFWASRNAFDDELHDLNTELASLQQRYNHDAQQLDKLQRTNVYNDTFCIGHDGYFGTINGLRLGRLPNQNVEWAEINAAWGQTLLLLVTVAERLGYTFQGYRPRPLGSTSRIEKIEWPQQSPDMARANATSQDQRARAVSANPPAKITQLDLYSSGETAIGRVFNHRRFDAGLVAFLDCLAQVGEHVEKTSSNIVTERPSLGRTPSSRSVPSKRVLPYPIQGDKIGDVSIKLGVGFQQDENFTKACKYALTCCKFLLAHISNLDNPKG